MIKSQTYNIVLAYCELAALEGYLTAIDDSLKRQTVGASFSADHNGVTIHCISGIQADTLWNLVLNATDEESED